MSVRAAVMTGVGGTIGTGLFLSSGDVIATAGPGGAIVMYIIGGLMVWLMTTCLGELTAAMPVSGHLQAFGTEFLSPSIGFTLGWVNWVGAAMTISAQVVASAIFMQDILPGTSTVLWIIVFALLMFGLNVLDAKIFGDVSFWLSSLKLILIVGFIIVGVGMMGGAVGGDAIGFSNFTGEGGAFPGGIGAMGAVVLTAFYAYAGTEVIGSTAGELEDENKMGRTINMTLLILIGAVVLAIAVVAAVLPYQQADTLGSPFVYAFRNAGMHRAALLVNIIVLSSALSSGNYWTYACARYLWSLSKFGQAPKFFSKTAKNGVPIRAMVVSLVFGLIGIAAEFFAADTVYLFIVYFIGGGNIFMYTCVCLEEYYFRKRYIAEGGKVEDLPYRVASYPLVPILGVISFVLMFVASLIDPGERTGIIASAVIYFCLFIVCHLYVKRHGGHFEQVDAEL